MKSVGAEVYSAGSPDTSHSRTNLLLPLLVMYLVATQTAMAAMNIAELLLLICVLFVELRRNREACGHVHNTDIESIHAHGENRFFRLSAIATKSAAAYRDVGFPSWRTGGFAALLFIGAIFAWLLPLSWAEQIPWSLRLLPLTKLWYGVWAYLLYRVLTSLSQRQFGHSLLAYFSTVPLFGILGIQQFWTGWPRAQPIPGFANHFHVILLQGHHLAVASIFIFPVFILAGAWLKRNALTERYRIAWGVSLIIGFLALFGTWSRTLWVALIPGVVVLLLTTLSRKMAAALIASAALIGLALTRLPFITQRLETSMGTQERYTLWRLNWGWFLDRPVFGIGFLQSEKMAKLYFDTVLPIKDAFRSHAHNNLLEMLAGTGIIGAAAWLIWNGAWLRDLWRAHLSGPQLHDAEHRYTIGIPEGLLAALVTFHLNGLTQVNFWEGKELHTLAVAFALTYAIGARQKSASR